MRTGSGRPLRSRGRSFAQRGKALVPVPAPASTRTERTASTTFTLGLRLNAVPGSLVEALLSGFEALADDRLDGVRRASDQRGRLRLPRARREDLGPDRGRLG